MPQPEGYDYTDIGGGINEGGAPSEIQSRQMTHLRNFYPYGTRLRRRGGVSKVTTGGAWDQNITGMFPLKKSDGTWVLLVSGLSKFGKLASDTISNISMASDLTITSSALPTCFFQYKDYVYCLRRGNTGLIRLTEDTARRAGIVAPATAMTIAQGAAGALVTGNYITVCTFYNRATALESNPSPVSNTLALGASRKIDYSAIPVSSDPFVDARRLYRTLENQVGVYFFTVQIDDNITTVYTGEEKTVSQLGRTVSFDNGVPPATLEVGTIWQERLFATDGVDLFFSEVLLAECFGDESVIPVFPDDGHRIRGLHAYGDRLIIGKTNKMHYLVGNSRATFGLQTLSDRHGCMSHHSLQSAEGTLFWYGNGKSVFKSDGTSVSEISSIRIKPTLEAIPDELEEYVVGGVFEQLNWYVLSVPQTGYTTNRKVLVYNYKTDSWTVFDHPSDAPQFISDFFNTNYGHILYATFYDNHIYHYNDENYGLDFGNTITAQFRTKADPFGHPGYRKYFREVWLLLPDTEAETLDLEVFRDELDTATLTRSVSIDGISGWKAFKMPTQSEPGTKLQLQCTYEGEQAIDIDAIHFEVGTMARKPVIR